MINSQPANPSGKAFVEPKLIPPIHGDKVTEPLVGQFYDRYIRQKVINFKRKFGWSIPCATT